jgi:hypothetical protein
MLPLPTTTKTIEYQTLKAAGGDYTNLLDFEAQNRDLVSEDVCLVLTCDNLEDTSATVNFTGWTLDADHWIYIRAADKHGSGGAITTNAYRLNTGGANQASIGIGNVGAGGLIYFEGIQILNTSSATATLIPNNAGVAGIQAIFINCVIVANKSGQMCMYYAGGGTTYPKFTFINCALTAIYNHAVHNQSGNPINCYNSVLVSRAGYALYSWSTVANVIVNSYLRGTSGSIFQEGGSTLICTACSDTKGNPDSLDSIAFTTTNFVSTDTLAEDYHLVEGTTLESAGTGASAYGYNYDIDENLRRLDTPDVGLDERISQGDAGAGGGGGTGETYVYSDPNSPPYISEDNTFSPIPFTQPVQGFYRGGPAPSHILDWLGGR